jgi:hypothetical protein
MANPAHFPNPGANHVYRWARPRATPTQMASTFSRLTGPSGHGLVASMVEGGSIEALPSVSSKAECLNLGAVGGLSADPTPGDVRRDLSQSSSRPLKRSARPLGSQLAYPGGRHELGREVCRLPLAHQDLELHDTPQVA